MQEVGLVNGERLRLVKSASLIFTPYQAAVESTDQIFVSFGLESRGFLI